MLCPSPARVRALGSCTLALLVASLTASAQPRETAGKTLAILQLETPPTMMGLGAQVAQRIEASACEQGFAVLAPSGVQERLGPLRSEQLRKCGTERACILRLLSPLGFDEVVFGSLGRDERSYLLKLWLVNGRTGEVLSDADRAILIASRRFAQDVAELVPRLLRGEREARGTLKVNATAKNADVWIDGELVGKTPVELQLKPGKYEVRLEGKAYLPIKRFVDVFANEVTVEEFRMILEPNGLPEAEQPRLVARQQPEQEPGLRVTVPAWIAFGTAAALAGTGVYFGSGAQRIEYDLRDGQDPVTGVYQGTRADALKGQDYARAANVLFGAAGAAAVAGVLFTLFDVGGDAGVTAVPSVSSQGAGVSVGGSF